MKCIKVTSFPIQKEDVMDKYGIISYRTNKFQKGYIMKKNKKELVIRVYDDNAPSVNDKILEAFEKFLKIKLTKEIRNKKGNN